MAEVDEAQLHRAYGVNDVDLVIGLNNTKECADAREAAVPGAERCEGAEWLYPGQGCRDETICTFHQSEEDPLGGENLCLPDQCPHLALYGNDGIGNFTFERREFLTATPRLLGIADITDDANPDIIVYAYDFDHQDHLWVKTNRGDGAFDTIENDVWLFDVGNEIVYTGDVDEDGHTDVVIGEQVYCGDNNGGLTGTIEIGGSLRDTNDDNYV